MIKLTEIYNLSEEVFEGKPFMQSKPNEFAYLDFKKWAYPRRGKIKQQLQTVLTKNQLTPGDAFFKKLTEIWVIWANSNDNFKAFRSVPTDIFEIIKFGRALAVMMKKDNLIIKSFKDSNSLLDLKEEHPYDLPPDDKALDERFKELAGIKPLYSGS